MTAPCGEEDPLHNRTGKNTATNIKKINLQWENLTLKLFKHLNKCYVFLIYMKYINANLLIDF